MQQRISFIIKALSAFLFVFACVSQANATHNRAGEIIYQLISPFTYEVTVITYTKASSVQADRDSLEVIWGDGTSQWVYRTNGPDPNNDGIHEGEILGNDIKRNLYPAVHQYPGSNLFYIISVADPNRISSIVNINNGNSVNTPFYIEDTLFFNFNPSSIGFNSSPILLNPPIDWANVMDTFYHNPNAYDPDGDSLTFELIVPLQQEGNEVPFYEYPDEIIAGPNNIFTIDFNTGELVWAVPQQQGIYNIAILVREYRRVSGNAVLMGTLIRDMQIIVRDEMNDPPQVKNIRDTCVIAGDLLVQTVEATDPQLNQAVTLTADGGPFAVTNSPATFTDDPANPNTNPGNPAFGQFRWQTLCEHIRPQTYQVVFKAEDNFSVPLADLQNWLIQVVAPPPENLTAEIGPDEITVRWQNPYSCESFENFVGFSVWRRLGSNPFNPDNCETGLNGRGYTRVADRLFDHEYIDTDVSRGNLYCYRILAHFAEKSDNGTEYNPVESIPSDEICAELLIDVPLITNVSVTNTDAINGSILVRWTKPLADPAAFDTLLNPGPYRFELYHSDDFLGSNFSLIKTVNSNTFKGLTDTSHIDSLINTTGNPWSYKVVFYAQNGIEIGESNTASSIFLSINAADKKLNLSWEEYVPWVNFEYDVYRLNKLTSAFDYITTVQNRAYTDEGLDNDSLYCYYVQSVGQYTSLFYTDTLRNNSQENCERPIDTIPPCPPTIAVENDCEVIADEPWEEENFVNRLSWTILDGECANDIEEYRIYFSAPGDSQFNLIGATFDIEDRQFEHELLDAETGLAGCYAVSAVDEKNNESTLSEVICVDNCPFYDLPNVFTPNGDGQNDLFHPFLPLRFVNRIDIKIFNRWGNLVFESTDPMINWDGTDMKTGKDLAEDVYFYSGFLYEERVDGERKIPFPTDGDRGFIHLIRANKQ